jgi:hypothetical protein
MPAVVVANRQDFVMGNQRAMSADLSSVDNADFFQTGFSTVSHVSFTAATAAAGTQVGVTRSGGLLTFQVESGSLAGMILVLGT